MKLNMKLPDIAQALKDSAVNIFRGSGILVQEVGVSADINNKSCVHLQVLCHQPEVSLVNLHKASEALSPYGTYVGFARVKDGYRLQVTMTTVPIANFDIKMEIST